MESAITAMGQTTIPKPVRDFLGLKPGDRVRFFVQPDGTVALLPRVSVTALRGMVSAPLQPFSLESMDAAIAASVTDPAG